MLEFLPYYSEIRLGGHIACAYLATIVGIVGLYIGRILGKSKISSGAIALFSITLSGLLWVIAFFGINRGGMSRTICVASFDFVFPDSKNNISRKLEANFCSLVLLCCIANLVVLGYLLLLFQLIFL